MSLVKEIKYKRLSKEERFFLETIDGMIIKEQTEYPNSVFWKKNGEILFEQRLKKGWLIVNYNKIWKVFSVEFGIEYHDITYLIICLVEHYLKWNVSFILPDTITAKRPWIGV